MGHLLKHFFSSLGWEDAPLAREGRDEARKAGQLLKAHGFEFDVVYTVSFNYLSNDIMRFVVEKFFLMKYLIT